MQYLRKIWQSSSISSTNHPRHFSYLWTWFK